MGLVWAPPGRAAPILPQLGSAPPREWHNDGPAAQAGALRGEVVADDVAGRLARDCVDRRILEQIECRLGFAQAGPVLLRLHESPRRASFARHTFTSCSR